MFFFYFSKDQNVSPTPRFHYEFYRAPFVTLQSRLWQAQFICSKSIGNRKHRQYSLFFLMCAHCSLHFCKGFDVGNDMVNVCLCVRKRYRCKKKMQEM